MTVETVLVPSTKIQSDALRNGHHAGELDEEQVVARLADVLAEAASGSREIAIEDPRRAARRAAVDLASAMLGANSAETAAHSSDVDVISEGIGRSLGLSGQRLEDVMVAARLHDIGKVGVPQGILEKPGPLDLQEWNVIHRHTIIGEQILLAVPELRPAARLVRHSHERWDGTGYPDRLTGEEISLGSRIVFCADAFHAIRSDRRYRPGRSAAEALAEIRACAGTQFDPMVVDALETLAGELRLSANGGRPRSGGAGRLGRLMALLLIVGVGATGSAFARSGVFPTPKPVKPEASATAAPAGSPSQVSGEAQSPGLLGLTGWNGQPDSMLLLAETRSSNSLFALLGIPPQTAGVEPIDGVIPPQGQDQPGVRDHGQGVGRGKGKGKGRGHEQGKRHQKGHGSASSGSGRSKGHSKSSQAAKPHRSAPKSSTKGSTSASNAKGGSGHASTSHSSSSGGAGQASNTTKPPKTASPSKPAAPPPPSPAPSPPSTTVNGNGNSSTGANANGGNSSPSNSGNVGNSGG